LDGTVRWVKILVLLNHPPYHLDRTTSGVLRHGGQVACCGACLDARGLGEAPLVEGAERGTLEQCTDWTLWPDKVISF
jgi:uncharacterized protein involved in oxidation of intracellular sulfur